MSPADLTSSSPVSAAAQSLRIVVVNDFAKVTGGSDRVALNEAIRLARRGHQVTVVAGEGQPDEELLAAGVEVRTTDQPSTIADPVRLRAAARGIWNVAAAGLLREVLNRCDPRGTVIHIHGFTKVLSSSVVRVAVKSRLPVTATLHDYFAACPNGGFFNYQSDEICRLRPLSARCLATHCDARSYSHKLWRVGRTAVQHSAGAMPAGIDHLIAPSGFAADVLRPYLSPRARLHVLPNPVPAERVHPTDPAGNRAFVFLGRLSRDKGPALFARAAREAGVPALFIGDGDQREAIRRANPDAELLGWLEPGEVRLALRGARALVSASLWYETQGLSPLEAASQGVPSIVSDVSVLRELVEDGTSGLWFRGGDPADLARKLTKLDSDPDLAARMGAEAYRRFWNGAWDVDTHLDRLETIYRAIL